MKRNPEFAGLFETHITIALPVDNVAFNDDCSRLRVKPIVIALPAGETPIQPMTSAVYHGTLSSVLETSEGVASELRSLGYEPTRLKIEAGHQNQDLPESDDEARALSASYYYEHHLKILVRTETERDQLANIATDHEAHLSTNALKRSADGTGEYFVTVRSYGVGRSTVEHRIDQLVAHLREAAFPVLKRICEYCVYDSNLSLDEGWK